MGIYSPLNLFFLGKCKESAKRERTSAVIVLSTGEFEGPIAGSCVLIVVLAGLKDLSGGGIENKQGRGVVT